MLKGKILGTFLLLLCFGLLASSVSAVETPVEVERIKDVCYVRVRGSPRPPPGEETKTGYGSLLLSYKNLVTGDKVELKDQWVEVAWNPAYGGGSFSFWAYPKSVEDTEDFYCLAPGPIGTIFVFEINVYGMPGGPPAYTISGAVVIPPP